MFALQTIEFDTDESAEAVESVEQPATPVLDPWTKARCRDGHGTLTHLFFSDELHDIARAKAICSKCTLTEACLRLAIANEEPWGVWGGQLVVNGRVIVNKRPRGRPPKQPRPELVVDEVPLPPHLVA
jgi:WhiB family redox-sensing transcriptional regulator